MRWFALVVPALVGCATPAPERPSTCTPEELGWSGEDDCFFDQEARFLATTLRECGLASDGGTSDCWWSVRLTQTSWTWHYSDVSEEGSLVCAGDQLLDVDGELLGEWLAEEAVLVWQDAQYEPGCPSE